MSTWLVNLLSSLVGVGVLVLAHYNFIPTDIAGIVAGAMMYQLGGQAYHFTTNKNNTMPTNVNIPTIASDTVSMSSVPLAIPNSPEHPTAKGP